MEHAWVVSRDHEVEAVLAHPDLHVRPPGEPVPSIMVGSALGRVYARLVRMNDGERHRELRARVEAVLAGWDLTRVAELARDAVRVMDARDVGGYVVASMIGLRGAAEAVPLVRDFAGAIAGGATEDAMIKGITATERLLALLPQTGDPDLQANLLGLLFQSYAAVGVAVENRVLGSATPPVVMTRRWAAHDLRLFDEDLKRGDVLVVMLTASAYGFGSGPHACPGKTVVSAIINAVAEALEA